MYTCTWFLVYICTWFMVYTCTWFLLYTCTWFLGEEAEVTQHGGGHRAVKTPWAWRCIRQGKWQEIGSFQLTMMRAFCKRHTACWQYSAVVKELLWKLTCILRIQNLLETVQMFTYCQCCAAQKAITNNFVYNYCFVNYTQPFYITKSWSSVMEDWRSHLYQELKVCVWGL